MPSPPASSLAELMTGTPYVSYAYSYPHKLAYRRIEPAPLLSDLWRDEPREALFLYLHIPFCEYRCGFCNLFTQSQPAAGLPQRYLDQLAREAEQVRAALGDCRFARMAVGGGTPTFLELPELEQLWRIMTDVMGADSRMTPISVEASPATITGEKLAFLREMGVERLSLGVQSFDDETSGRLGRPQRRAEAEHALHLLTTADFPVLNLDLIYGAESQSLASWLTTVRTAIDFCPDEVYLYPLYVRDQTGLGKVARVWDDCRLTAYRAARDTLREAGYEQVSMRMFAKPRVSSAGWPGLERLREAPESQPPGLPFSPAPATRAPTGRERQEDVAFNQPAPVYCCQSDGMVGLGCGARSYTTSVHYSTEYAVSQSGVKAILGDYLARDPAQFEKARHGIVLDGDEQRRRFVLLSLLQRDGLDCDSYASRFGTRPLDDLPQLNDLTELQLATRDESHLRLNDRGMELSDVIGPWLASPRVRELMEVRATCLT